MVAIRGGRRPPQPSHPTFTNELWELMQRCWDEDHLSRPGAFEVLGALRSA